MTSGWERWLSYIMGCHQSGKNTPSRWFTLRILSGLYILYVSKTLRLTLPQTSADPFGSRWGPSYVGSCPINPAKNQTISSPSYRSGASSCSVFLFFGYLDFRTENWNLSAGFSIFDPYLVISITDHAIMWDPQSTMPDWVCEIGYSMTRII